AGEVVAHNRANKAAVFNTLIADKVTVTNALSSASYKDALSVAGGSVIGELVAETLEVRDGVVTLGRESGSTAMTLQGLNLQNDATLLLNQQTQLAVTDSMTATENALVQMKNGAGISYGEMSISNNGSSATTTVNAYELATGNLSKVENAHVAVESDADTTVDYQLVNATVENRGSGKLTVTHAQNSITAVRSEGGAIDILNVDTSDAGTVLKLATLELHEGATLGVYTGDTVDAAQEAWVQVSGSAVFGKGTTINADLELMEGCSLTLGGTVDMGSNLRINGTLTLDGELLAQIQAAEIGASFDLFTGIDNLYLSGVQYDSIALSDGMAASTYFVGLEDSLEAERGYRLTYASATPGEGVLSVHVVTIPEPTTATLSFLALAGLMLRRRRK
ncbi:MAG: PEP-CTERM sorting domain-containing protein, partial [Akkermansia sp.]|nr:PEP-CTERM sorting domain-containing protein [Akkermansia sp.]